MPLTRFGVRGFQSYIAEQSLAIAQDVTLLAGRNNVGKSALLRAMRSVQSLESGAAQDFRIAFDWTVDPRDLLDNAGADIRGELESIFVALPRDAPIRLEAWLQQSGVAAVGAVIDLSDLVNPQVGNLEISGAAITVDAKREEIRLFARRGQSPPGRYLWWSDGRAWAREHHVLVRLVMEVISRFSTEMYFISPRRSTDRMNFGTTTALAPDGSNLTTVIATLFTNSRHGKFAELEAFAKDVFPEIEHLEVPMEGSPPAAEIFLAIGRVSGRGVSLKYSGTGIEQALMLATAILTSPPGYLFLVDEPHAFLHPLAERRVLRVIREHTEHQYVVATHSPAFLNAYPLTQAHLITVDETGSQISDVSAHKALLDELGVTAADLWGSSAIIWLEGDSDVAIARVATALVPETSVTFRPMPDAIRVAARGRKYAKAAADMSNELAKAITAVDVAMLFVFDADERGDTLRSEIGAATNGLARFLPVREAENMLLSDAVLAADIASQAQILQLPVPAAADVANHLAELLHAVDDHDLYPVSVDQADSARIVGSEVLRRLYWKWTQSEYDKVRDGERLARRIAELEPDRLEPLVNLMREVGVRADATKAR